MARVITAICDRCLDADGSQVPAVHTVPIVQIDYTKPRQLDLCQECHMWWKEIEAFVFRVGMPADEVERKPSARESHKCPCQCGRGPYSDRKRLLGHVRKSHPEWLASSEGMAWRDSVSSRRLQPPVTCAWCEKVMAGLTGLSAHQRSAHYDRWVAEGTTAKEDAAT